MNPYDHRPITFNGVELPAEMMGIDILERLVSLPESVADWLWRLPICKGLEKHSDSFLARNASEFARDALLEHRSTVLAGIKHRLPAYDAEVVYKIWMEGLTQIIELSHTTSICRWMAPLAPNEPAPTPERAQEFLQALEKMRQKIAEDGSGV